MQHVCYIAFVGSVCPNRQLKGTQRLHHILSDKLRYSKCLGDRPGDISESFIERFHDVFYGWRIDLGGKWWELPVLPKNPL